MARSGPAGLALWRLLARTDLASGERLVALSLASFAGRERRAWPGAPAASARAGLSRSRSGHGPFDGARQLFSGRVGGELSVEQGYEAARATALSMLASLRRELGELDRVTAWIKVLGFVKCPEGFNVTPAPINGFSDLILELWRDAGRHARSAIGAGELPMGMPVAVEAVVGLA